MAMRTNIDIDDTLMAEARKASGQTTKKDTVEQALRLMIRLLQQRGRWSRVGQPLARKSGADPARARNPVISI
jgi:Arc/MetJ family transcription regulator